MTKVDLPPPETPVTQRNLPNGNFTSKDFRLLPVAPLIVMFLPLPFLLTDGTSILFSPDKYRPVIDFEFAIISPGVPAATTWPP